MRPWAFYHDHDELKCEVIREAIKARAITDGEVVCGDIRELAADDVRGFRRVHCFAGGGFWDLALNQAGWGDGVVWTGSCPCPSFSAAGKGRGFDDPRHLWPDWFRLIRECRPPVVIGEQVSAAIRYGWFDLVHANLEAEAYAVGALVFGAGAVGAPHIRQRLYFVGVHHHAQLNRWGARRDDDRGDEREQLGADGAAHLRSDARYTPRFTEQQHESGERLRRPSPKTDRSGIGARSAISECADAANGDGWRGERGAEAGVGPDEERRLGLAGGGGLADGLHPVGAGLEGHGGDERAWRGPGWLSPQQARSVAATGATRGFWAGCDWWYGRDGKYRPAQSRLPAVAHERSKGMGRLCDSSGEEPQVAEEDEGPLAHKSEARFGRLRLYGDAIVVEQAKAWIETVMETMAAMQHEAERYSVSKVTALTSNAPGVTL